MKNTRCWQRLEEKEQNATCFDDITGKELPWHAVRKARELELKYLRDLGVYEKIDENEAVAQYNITPVDTKWVDTDKAFDGEPMQIRSRTVAKEFKSDDRPVLYAGTSSTGSDEGHNIDRSKPQGNLLNHAHRRVTCILPCKGQEAGAVMITSGGQNGCRRWEGWSDEKEHVWHSVIDKSTSKARASNPGSARRICFTVEGIEFQE